MRSALTEEVVAPMDKADKATLVYKINSTLLELQAIFKALHLIANLDSSSPLSQDLIEFAEVWLNYYQEGLALASISTEDISTVLGNEKQQPWNNN